MVVSEEAARSSQAGLALVFFYALLLCCDGGGWRIFIGCALARWERLSSRSRIWRALFGTESLVVCFRTAGLRAFWFVVGHSVEIWWGVIWWTHTSDKMTNGVNL